MEHWARKGIVGRGVLLDLRRADPDYDAASSHAFSVDDLERARVAAGVDYEPGDVLLLHTGFLGEHRRRDAEHRGRQAIRTQLAAPGVEHSEAMAEYLWDSRISAAVGDNPTVEVWPPDESPEAWPFGYLHYVLIGQLGLALGELWWLEDLAAACATDGRATFLLSSAPTNARGAVGSAANAVAIR